MKYYNEASGIGFPGPAENFANGIRFVVNRPTSLEPRLEGRQDRHRPPRQRPAIGFVA